MAGMIEVAKATVTIIPTMQGAQQQITADLTGASVPAGTSAGKAAGKSMIASMSDTLGKAGKTLTKSVTVPLAAIGAASIAAWKEVDNGLDTIIEKTGATGDALSSMEGILNNITASIPTDFATAGAAIGEVNTRFGATGKELEELSEQFIMFAQLNKTDVSNSVDTVQKALAAFGKNSSEATMLLDALTAAGQKTGASVDTLANGLIQNGTAFQELGLDMYQATMFMAQLETSGANSETVMQGLRKALKNAASDGVSLNDALANLQSEILNGTDGVDGLTAAYEIFGRSGDQIYGAVRNGTIDFSDLAVEMDDLSGTVKKTFDETLDPMDQFTTVMNQLKSVGADLVISVGPSLSSALGTVADVIKDLADGWNSLSPGMQDFIIKAGLVAMAAGPVISTGGKLVGGLQSLTSHFQGAGGQVADMTSKLGGLGSSGTSAATGATSAASSFGTLAGQALLLIAAGAAVFLIAEAMNVLVQSAIALSSAGPEAIATFVGIAAVAVGVTAAIVAIGSAATVSAAGLLALGAAVLMVSAGISLIIISLASFCEQLPTVATYGGDAALALVEMAGGMNLMTVAAVALTVSLVALTAGFGATALAVGASDLAFVAFLAECLLVDVELVVMAAALLIVEKSMTNIAQSARSAADDLKYMVSAVDVVEQFLEGLADVAEEAWDFVSGLFSKKSQEVNNTTKSSMANVNSTLASGMSTAQKTVASSLNSIQSMFANTKLSFNKYIQLPHFMMSGTFNAQKGIVPKVSVSWYRDAATQGAVFSSPSIIGVGDAQQPEMLIGEETLYQNIAEATGERGDTIIPVYIGGELLDTVVAKANKRATYRSGGR